MFNRHYHLIQRTGKRIIVFDPINLTLKESTSSIYTRLKQAFIPRQPVDPAFNSFSYYSFLSSVFSSIGGVLSMQALLSAATSSSAVTLAASVSWILKDGLGQIGGIAFSTRFGAGFDRHPRLYRFYAMVALQTGSLVEVLLGLCCSSSLMFLVGAGTANALKNISWMSMSATRTRVMDGFQQHGNIAQLTAIHWSQCVAANIVGMGGGIGVACVAELVGVEQAVWNLGVIPVFAGAAVYCCWRSCQFIELKNLTAPRVARMCSVIFRNSSLAEINLKDTGTTRDEPILTYPTDFFPLVKFNPPISASLVKKIDFEFAEECGVYVAGVEGKYYLWFPGDVDNMRALTLLICVFYCSLKVQGLSDREMLTYLHEQYRLHRNTVTARTRELMESGRWTLTNGFIPNSLLLAKSHTPDPF